MGQTSGHQERSKKPEVAPSEVMEAEIEVQNNKEETKEVKAKNQKLISVFGLADLKNGNNVLPILHCHIFYFSCLLLPSLPIGLIFSYSLSPLRNIIQIILILPCQVTILSFF